MPDRPPYTVRLLPSTHSHAPHWSPPHTTHTTTATTTPQKPQTKHQRRLRLHHHPTTAPPLRTTLLDLPAALLHASILPYLAHRHRLTQLTHIASALPPLHPTAFRHDHLTLTTHQAAWYPKTHPAYLRLAGACHSLWLDAGTLAAGSGGGGGSREDVKRDVLLATLTLVAVFGGVQRLRVPLPSVSVFAGVFLARLVGAGAAAFGRCHTVLLDEEDGLRKLAVEQVQPLALMPVLQTVRLANCRVPLSTLTFLCSLPSLTILDASDCWYSPFDVSTFTKQPNVVPSSQLSHIFFPGRSEGRATARCTAKFLQYLASSPASSSLLSLSLRGQICGEGGLASFKSLTTLSVNVVELEFLHSLYSDSATPLLPSLQHLSLSCTDVEVATDVGSRGSLQTMLHTSLELYRAQLRSIRLELPFTTLISNLLRPISACPLLSSLHLSVRAIFDTENGMTGGGGSGHLSTLRLLDGMSTLTDLTLDGLDWSAEQLNAVVQASSALRRLVMTRMEWLTATALQAVSASCRQLEQLHLSALHCAPPQQLQHLHQLAHLQLLGGLEFGTLPRALQSCVYPPLEEEDGEDSHWAAYEDSSSGDAGLVGGHAGGGAGRWDESADRALWQDALRFVARVRVKGGKVVNGREHFFEQLSRLCAQNEKSSKRKGPRKQKSSTTAVT